MEVKIPKIITDPMIISICPLQSVTLWADLQAISLLILAIFNYPLIHAILLIRPQLQLPRQLAEPKHHP